MERFSREVITRLEVEPQKQARSNRLTAMFHRAEQGDQKDAPTELFLFWIYLQQKRLLLFRSARSGTHALSRT